MKQLSTEWEKLARRASVVIGEEEPVRLELPAGRLLVDHPRPVLLVHRCAGDVVGNPSLDRRALCWAAHRLVTTQPSYLIARRGAEEDEGLQMLVEAVAATLAEQTGTVLVLEVWVMPETEHGVHADPFEREPGFTVYVTRDARAEAVADILTDALSEIEISGQGADVRRASVETVTPPGLPRLLGDGRFVMLGLAIEAIFLNARDQEFYPSVLDELRRALAPALRQAAEAFERSLGDRQRPLARRHLEPAAEEVDRGLASVARQYDLLLQITPVNSQEAWDDFRTARYDLAPELLYRPVTFYSDRVRRELFTLPVDAIEDPLVAGLLRGKRDEMAAEIQLILDRETDLFLPGSLRLYGAPDAALATLAEKLISRLDEVPQPEEPAAIVGAAALAAAARIEMEYYRNGFDGFAASVEIRDDIPASLMVAKGQLLVGAMAQVPAHRVRALVAHEVDTHVLTYYNACAQPLRQLRYGLAGYEPLQEGLAVLAEWLVGELTPSRMRVLAARVLAARALVDGAEFVETFRLLTRRAGLAERAAFLVTLRIFRGGGFTKDMIYLKGLRDLLAHLRAGGAYWPLYKGKIALSHLPALDELRERGVLRPPPLRPRFASDPAALARLERARKGLGVLELL